MQWGSLLRDTGGYPVDHVPFITLSRHYLRKYRHASIVRDWQYIVSRHLTRQVAALRREVVRLVSRWPRLPKESAAVLPSGVLYSQLQEWNGHVHRTTESLKRLLVTEFPPEIARLVERFLFEG